MKRKYITPTTEVIQVSPVSMMATSSNLTINKGNETLENQNIDEFEVLGRDDNQVTSSDIWDSAW